MDYSSTHQTMNHIPSPIALLHSFPLDVNGSFV